MYFADCGVRSVSSQKQPTKRATQLTCFCMLQFKCYIMYNQITRVYADVCSCVMIHSVVMIPEVIWIKNYCAKSNWIFVFIRSVRKSDRFHRKWGMICLWVSSKLWNSVCQTPQIQWLPYGYHKCGVLSCAPLGI